MTCCLPIPAATTTHLASTLCLGLHQATNGCSHTSDLAGLCRSLQSTNFTLRPTHPPLPTPTPHPPHTPRWHNTAGRCATHYRAPNLLKGKGHSAQQETEERKQRRSRHGVVLLCASANRTAEHTHTASWLCSTTATATAVTQHGAHSRHPPHTAAAQSPAAHEQPPPLWHTHTPCPPSSHHPHTTTTLHHAPPTTPLAVPAVLSRQRHVGGARHTR